MTTVMFVGRPIADQVTASYIHLGYGILPTFDWTLFSVLVGIAAFNLGYSSGLGRPLQEVFPIPATHFPPGRMAMSATAMSVIGVMLFSAFVLTSGGARALLIVLGGRGNAHASLTRHSTGYLYAGINLLLPATLIFFGLWVSTLKRQNLYFAALTGVPLFCYEASMGDRSEMLPLLFGLPVIYYLWKGRRPRVSRLLVASIVMLIAFAFLREFRNVSVTGEHAVASTTLLTDPAAALASTFTKDDSEMFDTFCNLISVVPSRLPFQPFGPFTDVAIRALPRVLFPDKPLESPDQLVVTLWPEHYKLSRASSAFSILGQYYLYGGVIGVAVGAFAMGALLRQTWIWLLRHRNNLNAILLYSFVPSFTVILWRGTVTDTLCRTIFTIIPLVIMQPMLRSLGTAPYTTRKTPGSRTATWVNP